MVVKSSSLSQSIYFGVGKVVEIVNLFILGIEKAYVNFGNGLTNLGMSNLLHRGLLNPTLKDQGFD